MLDHSLTTPSRPADGEGGVRDLLRRPGQASLTCAPHGSRDEIEDPASEIKKFSGPSWFQATPSRDRQGEGVGREGEISVMYPMTTEPCG